MASPKLFIFPDNNSFELIFCLNFLKLGSNTPLFSGAVFAKPFCKVKLIRVSGLGNESLTNEDNLICQDDVRADFHSKGRVNIWKRLTNRNSDVRGIVQNPAMVLPMHKSRTSISLDGQTVASDLNFNDVGIQSSSRRCNSILEHLEKTNDGKALSFFEWMKVNGKLEKNGNAYNLILRVLGRKADWDGAEAVIKDMVSVSSCDLNYRVFNTLIYPCYKGGLVNLGSKWFRLMLDYKVRPNVATFGMLMSLYQKGCAVEKAEYTFSQMRNLKITCQSAYSALVTIYTRTGMYEKAEAVIGFLKEDRVVLNKENWLVMLNAYCQQGKLSDAEQVFCEMNESGFSPCIVAYNTMITGYGRVSRMDQAERLFGQLKEVSNVPDETTYRSLIEGWGRAGNYERAKFYCAELKQLGFKPNPSNLYTLMILQAKHEDEEGAKMTVGDMMMIGCQKPSVLGIVLQAYEKASRLEKVSSILEGPLYDHVLQNQTSCAILVTAYVKNCLIESALKVISEKKWEDPTFEDNLYHLLICSCKDSGHLENAVKIFIRVQKPANPNLNIFCTMIDIYSKTNMFSEAERLYTELKASSVELDMIAFNVVIRMYIKSGSLHKACRVLDIMDKQNNIVPDVYLLRDMLRIYQRCSMDDKLVDLYYKVLKNGEIWDEEMYKCVINCCARALPVDELSRLFDEMITRGFNPNTVTFNVMLNAYGKSRLFEKAKSVFWMAKKRGLIDVISYNTIIATYGKNRYLKNMSAAVRKMQFDGFSVSLEAYNCMLDAYGKEGEMDKLKSVLKRMKVSNCLSDHYTCNILINIYGEQGWIEEVGGVLAELKECGVNPDLCTYNTLIKAYGIAGMVGEAVDLVKEMREKGIEPDKITYTNLIAALRKNDMFLEAVKWSLWMKQMGL